MDSPILREIRTLAFNNECDLDVATYRVLYNLMNKTVRDRSIEGLYDMVFPKDSKQPFWHTDKPKREGMYLCMYYSKESNEEVSYPCLMYFKDGKWKVPTTDVVSDKIAVWGEIPEWT